MSIIATMRTLAPAERNRFLDWLDAEGLSDLYGFVTATGSVRQFFRTFFAEDRAIAAPFERQHLGAVRAVHDTVREASADAAAVFSDGRLRMAIEEMRTRYDNKLFYIFQTRFPGARAEQAVDYRMAA